MGYDSMRAWDRSSFEFNEDIQSRGGYYKSTIPLTSQAGSTTRREDYQPPSFRQATATWSPPASPKSLSRQSSISRPSSRKSSPSSRSLPHSPRRSSPLFESPPSTPMSAKEKHDLTDKLYAAACAGDLQHIRLLLSLGAPVNGVTVVDGLYEAFKPAKSGRLSPLAGAATYGNIEACGLLLEEGALINPDVNQSSSSPLHQACHSDDVATAQYLLAAGADVNLQNCYKTTPLMYGVKYGSPALVALLLSYKPDLSVLSFISSAAIHWAVWRYNKTDCLELVLEAGADPNHPLTDGSTPLHCAALSELPAVAKCLLQYGADPERRNEEWKTPLQVAEENGHEQTAAVLREIMAQR